MRTACLAGPMLEALESRQLFSVAPGVVVAADPPPVDCVSAEQITADRAKVHESMAKLRADHAECAALLAADRAALQAARAALEAQLAPLRQKLAEDQVNCAEMLHADRAAVQAAYQAGQATILADRAAVHAAGDDPVKRHEALAKLAADQQALQQTVAPLLQTLHEDSAECSALLAADAKAVSDALHNDTAVKAAHDKLAADTLACITKVAADRHQLISDMQKLRSDLAHRCPDDHPHG